jgi:hypothetical protein
VAAVKHRWCALVAVCGAPITRASSCWEIGNTEAKGFAIVINLGNQRSDLEGEPAELSLKLPNPFCYIP